MKFVSFQITTVSHQDARDAEVQAVLRRSTGNNNRNHLGLDETGGDESSWPQLVRLQPHASLENYRRLTFALSLPGRRLGLSLRGFDEGDGGDSGLEAAVCQVEWKAEALLSPRHSRTKLTVAGMSPAGVKR